MSKDVLSLKEIWKDIPGYEGYYQASTFGRIRSLDRDRVDTLGRKFRVKGTIRKPATSKDGYLELDLNCDGHVKYFRVRRLVAITFIPNPENKPEVNHKDGNKKNNSALNLEWVTSLENIHHAIETGLKRRTNLPESSLDGLLKSKFTNSKTVICEETSEVYRTITEASEKLHVTSDTIRFAITYHSELKKSTLPTVDV